MRLSVVYSPRPGKVDETALELPEGATVAAAIAASGLQKRHEGLAAGEGGAVALGVWGVLRDATHSLRDGDRVELYRPLQVDPMEARRRRSRQGGRPGR